MSDSKIIFKNCSGGFGGDTSDLSPTPIGPHDAATSAFYPLTPDGKRAIEAIEYITEHLKLDEEYKMVRRRLTE